MPILGETPQLYSQAAFAKYNFETIFWTWKMPYATDFQLPGCITKQAAESELLVLSMRGEAWLVSQMASQPAPGPQLQKGQA